jgi:hypothetical protein
MADDVIVEFGKVELVDMPELQEFQCWKCHGKCVIYPRAQPMPVQHQIPACDEWKKIEGKKEDIERWLIKSGLELLVPQAKA